MQDQIQLHHYSYFNHFTIPEAGSNPILDGLQTVARMLLDKARFAIIQVIHKLTNQHHLDHTVIKSCTHHFRVMPEQSLIPCVKTDWLKGRSYFFALSTDKTLPRHFRWMCRGSFLASNEQLSQYEAQALETKLRLVAFKLRTLNQAFRDKVESIALEALAFNGKSVKSFVNTMYGLSYLQQTRAGYLKPEKVLFNLGVVQCRLDMIEDQIMSRYKQARHCDDIKQVFVNLFTKPFPAEKLNTTLAYARFFLQARLNLPHVDQGLLSASECVLTHDELNQIADDIEYEMYRDDNNSLVDYLSQWPPWVALMHESQHLKAPLARLQHQYFNHTEKFSYSYFFLDENEKLHNNQFNHDCYLRAQSELFKKVTKNFIRMAQG